MVGLGLVSVAPGAAADPLRATPTQSYRAVLVTDVVARSAPSATARVRMRVAGIAPLGGDVTSLQVVISRRDQRGKRWLLVKLPSRPNGRRGWIPASHARIVRNRVRVVIDKSSRQLTVFRRNRPVLRTSIAVGSAANPTPTGSFATAERIYTGLPHSYLGPAALPLTGFSETLFRFNGGAGRLAIHGTNRPGSIGRRASHGCARVRNDVMLRIARMVPPGTPVLIRN